VSVGQVGGEVVVIELVDQLGELCEHGLANVDQHKACFVHGHTNGVPMEVGRMWLPCFRCALCNN
jgi:hypothetical protein